MARRPRSKSESLRRIRRNARKASRKHGQQFRSGLEGKAWELLEKIEANASFECDTIHFVSEPEKKRYTPDFKLTRSDGSVFYIETKGLFERPDQKKHLWLKNQHPDIDVRFIFSNPHTWYRKDVKHNTYARWCDKHGFKYCSWRESKKVVPKWLAERG